MIIGPIMQQRGSAQTLKGNKIIELLSSVPGNCFNFHYSEQTNRFFERRNATVYNSDHLKLLPSH